MKIAALSAQEIFDSRGLPTIETTLVLEDESSFVSSVPSGKSCGPYEASELRDGGSRLAGKGVQNALEKIEKIIAPALIDTEPNLIDTDMFMLSLDKNEQKSVLGANTMLAISMAVCRAQAHVEDLELYEFIAYLCGFETVSLMSPFFNIINGGVHANNDLAIQEFMILPIGLSNFRAALEFGIAVQYELAELLARNKIFFARGDEGGISACFGQEHKAFDFLLKASEKIAQKMGASIMFVIDAAAAHWYDKKSKLYTIGDRTLTTTELIAWYAKICEQYPIYAIEDGLSPLDVQGWHELYRVLGSKIHLIGDDIFATNPARIWDALQDNLLLDVIIKPNQIGTITETLQVAKLCRDYDRPFIVSHRSGETNDSFIVDLAIGTSAHHIKAGGLSGGERFAKYNRFLTIEDELLLGCQAV